VTYSLGFVGESPEAESKDGPRAPRERADEMLNRSDSVRRVSELMIRTVPEVCQLKYGVGPSGYEAAC
jgi:hypothetical protein